jgi:hypothetical protein
MVHMPVSIKAKQQAMLDTLRAMGSDQWVSRSDIAAHLHKNRINPSEAAMLELLVEQGVLERRSMPSKVEHINMTVYRIADQEAKNEEKSDRRARQKA